MRKRHIDLPLKATWQANVIFAVFSTDIDGVINFRLVNKDRDISHFQQDLSLHQLSIMSFPNGHSDNHDEEEELDLQAELEEGFADIERQ
jgi:hypothetical protein